MFRTFITFTVIVLIWHFICLIFNLPSFILPSPKLVAIALFNNFFEILNHSSITLLEIILSLLFGIILGSFFAILISISKTFKRWLMPILLSSQAIPVFALAPILVLWLGYGISSKIVIGTIIVFFPIASNFSDAINNIPKQYLHAGETLGLSKIQILYLSIYPSIHNNKRNYLASSWMDLMSPYSHLMNPQLQLKDHQNQYYWQILVFLKLESSMLRFCEPQIMQRHDLFELQMKRNNKDCHMDQTIYRNLQNIHLMKKLKDD